MLPYKIRPHHGLCLSFFEGKGYSKAFVREMARIKAIADTEEVLEITFQGDDICKSCPNLTPQGCVTQSKVERYDREVAILCDLQEEMQLSFSEFLERVNTQIIQSGKLRQVCGDCEWMDLCEQRCKDLVNEKE